MSFEPLEDLAGQTAIIAGAMGGIGYATAQRLAAKGARIIGLVRRDLDTAQLRISQLPNPHLNHIVLQADITDTDQLKAAKQKISQCDILVNAAGSSVLIPKFKLDLLTDKMFDKIITDNLRAQFGVIRTFMPLLKQSQRGLIVNIGSNSSIGTGGSNIAYAAAKAGLESITRNLALFFAPEVRVILLQIGGVETDFIKGRPEGYYDREAAVTPLGRNTSTEDVACTIEAYATTIRFATGVNVVVDGGKNLSGSQYLANTRNKNDSTSQ